MYTLQVNGCGKCYCVAIVVRTGIPRHNNLWYVIAGMEKHAPLGNDIRAEYFSAQLAPGRVLAGYSVVANHSIKSLSI